jgi:hypothetical protein
MSGNELALATIIAIAVLSLLFAFAMNHRKKAPREEP